MTSMKGPTTISFVENQGFHIIVWVRTAHEIVTGSAHTHKGKYGNTICNRQKRLIYSDDLSAHRCIKLTRAAWTSAPTHNRTSYRTNFKIISPKGGHVRQPRLSVCDIFPLHDLPHIKGASVRGGTRSKISRLVICVGTSPACDQRAQVLRAHADDMSQSSYPFVQSGDVKCNRRPPQNARDTVSHAGHAK